MNSLKTGTRKRTLESGTLTEATRRRCLRVKKFYSEESWSTKKKYQLF